MKRKKIRKVTKKVETLKTYKKNSIIKPVWNVKTKDFNSQR